MTSLTPLRVGEYVTALQTRERKWVAHPNRPAAEARLSPFTVRKEVKILRGFGTWLAKEGYDNPFAGLEIPKVPKYVVDVLTDQEIETILNKINPNTTVGARLAAMVLLMLDSGLRIGEVAMARLGRLDIERRQLKVMVKRQKERIVPFGVRCAQAILRYLHLHRAEPMRPEYDNLFLSLDGMPMTRNSLAGVLGRLKKASGVRRLPVHLFRHTFAVK